VFEGLIGAFFSIAPSVSRGARGQGQAFRVGQDPILKEPYLSHDIRHGATDFKRGTWSGEVAHQRLIRRTQFRKLTSAEATGFSL
jgi:hypothetical protein